MYEGICSFQIEWLDRPSRRRRPRNSTNAKGKGLFDPCPCRWSFYQFIANFVSWGSFLVVILLVVYCLLLPSEVKEVIRASIPESEISSRNVDGHGPTSMSYYDVIRSCEYLLLPYLLGVYTLPFPSPQLHHGTACDSLCNQSIYRLIIVVRLPSLTSAGSALSLSTDSLSILVQIAI